jgi:excisionase family DNA binding protein
MRLLTVTESARILNLKPSTLRAWILRRKIAYVKLGEKAVRIREEDLPKLVENGTVPSREVR